MSEMTVSPPPVTTILGVPIHGVTMAQTLALASYYIEQPGCSQIATANPEFVMAAQQDAAFMTVLRQADLCLPDGVGLVYAARRMGKPVPERVPGSELVCKLAQEAAANGWRLFLLGAAPGVAEEAGAILQARYPGLIIAGVYAGSPRVEQNDHILDLVNASRADLLFVAYGAPQQDKWIARNKGRFTTVRLALGVGGSLDFITGRAQRAPRWVQDLGLEWLHRLAKEPWRWRRMLALPRFAFKVMVSPPPDH